MTGADIIINCLKEQKVEAIFGFPGGTIINIYDALYRDGTIKHYLTSHEQGAAHAADGYARETGKVGVVFCTSGPGATNLVTGLATAYMDSSPVVAITCNVSRALLGKDTFQEVDIAGITMPITKHNYIVGDIDELADTVREAFYIAKSGRPGPVLIDIPKDITSQDYPFVETAVKEYIPTCDVSSVELKRAAEIINNSEKPFIIVGGGVVISGADKQTEKLISTLNCPVTATLMGIGGLNLNTENYTGMIGMHGTEASNTAVNECDVLVAVGTRFSDRVTSDTKSFATNCKIVHIDIDEAELGKNVKPECALCGDAKLILERLNKLIKKREKSSWTEKILGLKKDFPEMSASGENRLEPEYIIKKIAQITEGDVTVVTEVGQHQMWTAQFFPFNRPRQFITSGGLGTMGFGTGASMGVAVGNPNRRVVSIAGDGCFRMNCNELSTVEYYNLPVIYVVMNNGTLGMVRQWQTLFYGKRYSATDLDRGPDFKKLAEAYYIDGYTATNTDEFEKAFSSAWLKKAPAVIDVRLSKDEFVFPMVGPGQPIKNIIVKKD